MNNYDLAKAQQAFHPPMLEEIIQEQQEKIRQQQAEIDRLKFRIENSESLLEWENDGLKRQIQLFEDALYKAQEKIEALENDKVLHDEAYLSQMNEIEALKDDVKWLYDINVQRYPELKDGQLPVLYVTLNHNGKQIKGIVSLKETRIICDSVKDRIKEISYERK